MKRCEFAKNIIYDVIVIGGGITGAAVAYEAASRGLSVALVEKDDFGSKTSSATSKLIHGGLRYLANMELGLVRESLRERKTLENIAPNFVYPIPNMVLTEKNSIKSGKTTLKIGMILYDILSFDKTWTRDKTKKMPCHRTMSLEETIKAEPLIEKENLSGSVIYYDCASLFPERLTLAFLKSAEASGADLANYMKVTEFLNDEKSITGIKIEDSISGEKKEIKGRITVNCAGPWADKVLSLSNKSDHEEVLRRSEGIHIITRKLVNDHIVTAMTDKGRHIFIIPWRGHSLIGTTDKEYIGSPDDWKITKESIQELIDEVNSSFGDKINISYDDVLHFYGGLRPLVEDQTEDVYESSRKYEIYDNEDEGLGGLITVEGGTYTTSRQLAEHVFKLIARKLSIPPGKTSTDKDYLYGCEIEDMEEFVSYCREKYKDQYSASVDYLSRIYGTEIDRLMETALEKPGLNKPLNHNGEITAQVLYAVKHEMALKLTDIILRRTGIATLGHPGKEALLKTAQTAAEYLGWSSQRIDLEIKEAETALQKP